MLKHEKLKIAIFKAGLTQRAIAKQTGIPESLLSLAIHGRYMLDEIQKEKIAENDKEFLISKLNMLPKDELNTLLNEEKIFDTKNQKTPE